MRIRMSALSLVATVALSLGAQPAAFEPLDVRINFLDDVTATDLYGKKMAEDFYVVRVRFSNNLKIQKGPSPHLPLSDATGSERDNNAKSAIVFRDLAG